MRIPLAGLIALTLPIVDGHAATPTGGGTDPPASVLTLMIGGDLFRHAGVVVVYPTPMAAGTEAVPLVGPDPLRLEARYIQVQLRYPAGGHYTFRLRPAEDGPETAGFQTQLLSVFGTDEQGRGNEVHEGFAGPTPLADRSSGCCRRKSGAERTRRSVRTRDGA